MSRACEPRHERPAGELAAAMPERASILRSPGPGGAAVLVQPVLGRWDADPNRLVLRGGEGRQ